MACKEIHTNDNIAEPYEKDWNERSISSIDEDKCKGQNSEADGMAEEGKVSSNQLYVELYRVQGVNMANVDIEDIRHEGALEDVNGGEDQRPHEGVCIPKLVVETVCDDTPHSALAPWKVYDTLNDQEACHDQLNWSLNTASNAMRGPGNMLKLEKKDDI